MSQELNSAREAGGGKLAVEAPGLQAGDGSLELVAVGGGAEGFEAPVAALEDLGLRDGVAGGEESGDGHGGLGGGAGWLVLRPDFRPDKWDTRQFSNLQ